MLRPADQSIEGTVLYRNQNVVYLDKNGRVVKRVPVYLDNYSGILWEALLGQKLAHPNIQGAADYDVQTLERKMDRPFAILGSNPTEVVMRSPYLQPQFPLNLDELMTAWQDVACAIDWLHRLGLVHMDIKPDNMVMYRDVQGRLRAKVIDLGSVLPVELKTPCARVTRAYYPEDEDQVRPIIRDKLAIFRTAQRQLGRLLSNITQVMLWLLTNQTQPPPDSAFFAQWLSNWLGPAYNAAYNVTEDLSEDVSEFIRQNRAAKTEAMLQEYVPENEIDTIRWLANDSLDIPESLFPRFVEHYRASEPDTRPREFVDMMRAEERRPEDQRAGFAVPLDRWILRSKQTLLEQTLRGLIAKAAGQTTQDRIFQAMDALEAGRDVSLPDFFQVRCPPGVIDQRFIEAVRRAAATANGPGCNSEYVASTLITQQGQPLMHRAQDYLCSGAKTQTEKQICDKIRILRVRPPLPANASPSLVQYMAKGDERSLSN